MHCGVARRTVALLVERFETSGLSWPEAREMEEEALDAALYPAPPPRPPEDVDWARVEAELSGRGVTLRLLWEEWRADRPGGMSYPTWCRRFRAAAAFAARDDDAPGARPGRAAVRRLRRHDGWADDRRDPARGADLRRLDGSLGAGLRGGQPDPEDRSTGAHRTCAASRRWAACRWRWCRTTSSRR